MRRRNDRVAEAVDFLSKQYSIDLRRLIDENTPTIPATAFATSLTPFETAAHYLVAKGRTPKQAAQLLHRSKSSVANALANVARKNITPKETPTMYVIPVSAFADTRVTPAEAVILYLTEHYKLANADIARLLGRDSRNTWQQLQQALRKRGAP